LYDSSVKAAGSDDEDEVSLKHEMIVDDEKVIGWAKVCHTYSSFTNIPDGSGLIDHIHNVLF
jgi:hypothetical protein